jgi:thiamine biosynthesis lipoprotein
MADIHRLMSFHEPDSDVSRVNSASAGEEIAVDPRTFAVLTEAAGMAAESDGIFDITVAAELVALGLLPRPHCPDDPDPKASWRDIELTAPDMVRLRRPLWIDLGGIAKGYAVDRAVAAMNLPSEIQCSVNAGGDLRVSGPAAERILLRASTKGGVPVVELENASLASSEAVESARGPHLDGVSRRGISARRFVSVVAEDCIVADALTKIVLVKGRGAGEILARHGATAYLNEGKANWETIGAAN